MKTKPLSEIRGVIPAMVSCFDENEEYDSRRQRLLTARLIERGVNGLYLTGSTGEGFLMTPDERKRLVEDVIDAAGGRVPVIVHVGALSTKISADLARHAEKAGADAVSSVPPFYYKFGDDQIVSYYRDLAGSVGIPLVVYNIVLAGAVGFGLVKRLAALPGVGGIKYTLQSHFEILRLKEEIGKDFIVYSGSDEMAMSGLSFGADGLIGSFYNLIPEVFLDLYDAVKRNDLAAAREKQRLANAVIMKHLASGDYMAAMKRSMTWMGLDPGICRAPFTRIDSETDRARREEFRLLKKELEKSGYSGGVPFLDCL